MVQVGGNGNTTTTYIPEYVKVLGVSYSKVAGNVLVKGFNAIDVKFYKSEFDRLADMYTASRIQRAGIVFTDGNDVYIAHVYNDGEYNWYLSIRKLLGCSTDNLICYNNRGEEYIYIWDEVIPEKPVRKEDFKISIVDGIIYFNDVYMTYVGRIQPAFRILHVVENAQQSKFMEMTGTIDAMVYTAVPTYMSEFTRLNTISMLMTMMSLMGV